MTVNKVRERVGWGGIELATLVVTSKGRGGVGWDWTDNFSGDLKKEGMEWGEIELATLVVI